MWNPIDSIKDTISAVGTAVTQPIKDVLVRKEARKEAHQAAQSTLQLAEENNETTVEISKIHLDEIMQAGLDKSWKDEFVTVCCVGIIPAVVVGGVLEGFGFPGFLHGVLTGVTALKDLIPLGDIMTVVVSAAVGISTLKRLLR